MKYFISALDFDIHENFIKTENDIYIDLNDGTCWKKMIMLTRNKLESGYYKIPTLTKKQLFSIVFSYESDVFLLYLPKKSIEEVSKTVVLRKKKNASDDEHNFYGALSYLFNNHPYDLIDEVDQRLHDGSHIESIIELLNIELYCDDKIIYRLKEGVQKDLIIKWKQIKSKYNL